MVISLKESLHQIDALRPDALPLAVPGALHSSPRSVRRLAAAARPSDIASWVMGNRREFANETWTEECQGLTTDGEFWYISSNNEDLRAIHKFDRHFRRLGGATFPSHLGNHIGDIDYFEGTIYAAIEPSRSVAMFDTSPHFIGSAQLQPGRLRELPQEKMPWCAIHPWNGLLYTSNDDDVRQIHAYDPRNNFAYAKSLDLRGGVVNRVQGGVFSGNGRLYLASHGSKQIRAYSTLNGAFLGARALDVDDSTLEAEEVEGLAIWPLTALGLLSPLSVHIVILDNDLNSDDVYLDSFWVASADHL